jgi:hypothetical protein
VSRGLGMGIKFQDNLLPEHVAVLERWLEEAATKT